MGLSLSMRQRAAVDQREQEVVDMNLGLRPGVNNDGLKPTDPAYRHQMSVKDEPEPEGEKGWIVQSIIYWKLRPESFAPSPRERYLFKSKGWSVDWQMLHSFPDLMIWPIRPKGFTDDMVPPVQECFEHEDDVSRCIKSWTINNNNKRTPYHPLKLCAPQWEVLRKCCDQRNNVIVRAVHLWEREQSKTHPAGLDGMLKDLAAEESKAKAKIELATSRRDALFFKRQYRDVVARHQMMKRYKRAKKKVPISEKAANNEIRV
eukprot:Filipodium_phascolosomae@DN1059_c0_g1_i2.p1